MYIEKNNSKNNIQKNDFSIVFFYKKIEILQRFISVIYNFSI